MRQQDDVHEIANGKWPGLLGQWLDDRALLGKHTKCPMCGGTDRFRFDNKGGRGTWICNHCGAGTGVDLMMQINNWTFRQAADHIRLQAGRLPAAKDTGPVKDPAVALRAVWSRSSPIVSGDPANLYLMSRCGNEGSIADLRSVPDLRYINDKGESSAHPAMIAMVRSAQGSPLTLHRTYLTKDGKKASVESPKKLMTPIENLSGAAIRLAPVQDGWLGVAEGIETALCSSALWDSLPVWSLINAGGMKSFSPPDGVRSLFVFADNDSNFTGQAAAYELARRVSVYNNIEVRVLIPDEVGDWADVWEKRGAKR